MVKSETLASFARRFIASYCVPEIVKGAAAPSEETFEVRG